MLCNHFLESFFAVMSVSVSMHTHTHTYTPCSGMQFVSTQIRAGVIKIAYKVNLKEIMAAGEGMVRRVKGKLDTHFISSFSTV